MIGAEISVVEKICLMFFRPKGNGSKTNTSEYAAAASNAVGLGRTRSQSSASEAASASKEFGVSRTRSQSSASSNTRSRSSSNSSLASAVKFGTWSSLSRRLRYDKTLVSGEVLFYAGHFVFFYFMLVPRIGASVKSKCDGYHGCRRFMRETWLGYKVDLADNQWRDIRGVLVLLWGAMILVTALHRLLRNHFVSSDSSDAAAASVSVSFRLLVGLVFLAVQHGAQSLVVLVLCYVGYRLAVWQREAQVRSSALTWIYAMAVILFKESYRLMHLPGFGFLRPIFDQRQYGGLYGWQLPANFLVLRIVSFSLDLQWAWQAEELRREIDKGEDTGTETDSGGNVEHRSEEVEVDGARFGGAIRHLAHKKEKFVGRVGGIEHVRVDGISRVARHRGDTSSISTKSSSDVTSPSSSTSSSPVSSPPSSPPRQSQSLLLPEGEGEDNDIMPPLPPRQLVLRRRASTTRRAQTALVAARTTSTIPPATAAEETPRPLDQYNLGNFLAYTLYAPLYTAGPVISFNAFVENTHRPQRSEDPLRYGVRWLLCLALMELLTAWFPFFATIKSGLFPFLTCSELAVVAYMTLKMMWLKFLLVWRFFRLWAMADGTLAPENMRRCMSNNHSLEHFWKGWHSSFNRWIVRYMYKPMGGRGSRVWAVWPIFLFVAIWHDIEMKLLVWGMLNAFFFVLEVLAKKLAATDAFNRLPSAVLRLVCILSGATYILVLVGVNLIGYAGLGVGGTTGMMRKLISWDGLIVVFCTYYFLSVAVAFMSFLQRMGISQP